MPPTLPPRRALRAEYWEVIVLLILTLGRASAAEMENQMIKLELWPADSMEKVFKDAEPPKGPSDALVIQAARNETVSGQAVAWCAQNMVNLRCRASKFVLVSSGKEIAPPLVRYVGYVPVLGGKDPGFMLRKRPCDYPDPLLETPPAAAAARSAQPVWLTVKVPPDAAAGLYTGTLEAEAAVNGAAVRASLPLKLEVFSARLPEKRSLWITNWICDPSRVPMFCGVKELYSEAHWKLLEEVARNMAAHRQNVILTPLYELIEAKVNARGKLAFDFSRFDRWVAVFQKAGVAGRIEGSHLAGGSWGATDHKSTVWSVQDGKLVRKEVSSFGEEHKGFLGVFLPALQAHLEKQGWLANYVQHVFDEPTPANSSQYKMLAGIVREAAPGFKIIDACETEELIGAVDIWVPKIHKLAQQTGFYQERRGKGEETWFYTCCDPVGQGALNRFIEFPLTRVRLLHWANFAAGATGYLHWGWSQWLNWLHNEPGAGTYNWPPGDEWLVYPKEGGIRDSIRSEAMLEGIQDYELLLLLSAQDKNAAASLCAKLVRFQNGGYGFDDKPDSLRTVRLELLKALSEKAPK